MLCDDARRQLNLIPHSDPLLPATCYLLLYLLPTTYYLLPATYYLLYSTYYCTYYSTCYLQHYSTTRTRICTSTYYLLPTT